MINGSQKAQQLTRSCNSNSSGSSSDYGTRRVSNSVPASALPLLHHMLQEQVPVICSTLRLLRTWMLQQHQQQHTETIDHNSSSKAPSRKHRILQAPDGCRWLVVPRVLGTHSFELYDPASGRVAFRGARAAFSYVAWRAAEVSESIESLGQADGAALQQLLQQTSAVGTSSSSGGSQDSSVRATAGSNSPSNSSDHSRCREASIGDPSALAGGTVSATSYTSGVAGYVDAAAAMCELTHLVRECGTIGRMANQVVVKLECPAGGVMCRL